VKDDFGVRRQSETATALWLFELIQREVNLSGVALLATAPKNENGFSFGFEVL